jgi:DNA-binding transcriptional MerR regulator
MEWTDNLFQCELYREYSEWDIETKDIIRDHYALGMTPRESDSPEMYNR